MSSDIMIVCKELDNWVVNRELDDLKQSEEPAVCIGEASMGDPGEENEFANWFISRFFSGEDMLQQMMNQQAGYDKKKRQESNFQGYLFQQVDFNCCKDAIQVMSCKYLETEADRQNVITYLEKCIGKHISTENW